MSEADAILADIQRVIQQNLNHPDLAARSQEYRDGYARGFYEAMMAHVAHQIRHIVGGGASTLDVIGTTGGKATTEKRNG